MDVRPDGGEMRSHRWWSPEAALDAHHRDEISLAPPTFVTICSLLGHSHCDAVVNALADAEHVTFRPRICKDSSGQTCILYPGDAGYERNAPDRPGARHRLRVLSDGWRYERDGATWP